MEMTGPADEGVTVRVCIQRGAIVLRGSSTESHPSRASNDFSVLLNYTGGRVTPGRDCLTYHASSQSRIIDVMMDDNSQCGTNPGRRRRRQSEEEETVTIYITIEGVSNTESHFSVNSSFGEAFGLYQANPIDYV